MMAGAKRDYLPRGQKGNKKMKKNIFKKIVASLATVAMAAGLFTAMPAEEAKAAATVGGDGEVYLVGTETTWTPADAPKMTTTDGQTFKYTFDISEAKKVGFKLLVGDNTGWSAERNAKDTTIALTNVGGTDNFEIECGNVGSVTITATFDGSTLKSIKAEGSALGAVVLPDEYYAVGGAGLFEKAWGDDNFAGAKQLTETSTGVWSVTINNVEPATYEYKVLQLLTWDNAVTPDNKSVEVAVKSNVTITYTKATGEVETTVTPVENTTTTKPENTTTTKPEDTTTTKPEDTTTSNQEGETTTKPEETTTAKKGVTVEVTLSADAKWDKVFLHAWADGFGTQWPGVEMTAKDGKWYATLDTELTKLSFVVSNGNGEQTVDIVDVSGKEVKLTLGAKNADGKFEATGKTAAAGTAKPGDTAPIVVMLAVAAVAAGMVVASKKKTICE